MSRLPGRAGRLGLAAVLVLAAIGAAPAAAISVLPSPPALPIPPLPTPTAVLPLPTPTPAPLPVDPGGTIQSTARDLALPGTTVASAPSGPGPVDSTAGAVPASPAYQPSPDEQSSLPNEPGRIQYEQQQQDVSYFNDQMQQELGAIALEAGGGNGQFAWPVVLVKGQRVPLTQRYGCTDVPGEPYKGDCPSKRWHTGIDLGLPTGTPVFASDAGVARTFRTGTGYGNYVIVIHGNGYATLYGHLSDFAVRDGQVVKKGEQVGFVGSTGFSTGPHLHFEVRYARDYVDPCAELKC